MTIVVEQLGIPAVQESQCTCEECRDMCSTYPCWPTPEEAMALMDAGYGDKLMIDVWEDYTDGDYQTVTLLCPSNMKATRNRCAPCIFFKLQRCALHHTGLKPLEGRLAHHALPVVQRYAIHDKIALMWATPDGHAVVELWNEQQACRKMM